MYNWDSKRSEGTAMNLTNNEVKVLRVMWTAKRALSRREILDLNFDNSWDKRTIHALLNSMMEKGAIREAGYTKYGKVRSRLYEAVVTYEAFVMSMLAPISDIINYSSFINAIVNNPEIGENIIEQIIFQIKSFRQ